MISPFCPKCKYKLNSGSSICPVCNTNISENQEIKHELDNKIYDVHFGERTKVIPKVKKEAKDNSLLTLGIVMGSLLILLMIYIVSIFI